MIAVIDYGMGNLRSVSKALETVCDDVLVTSKPKDLEMAKSLVFPGVGAFGRALQELEERNLTGAIIKSIESGKPFLGLCLGLQLLFTESCEGGRFKGLNIFEGKVKKLPFKSGPLKIPQIGWNQIDFLKRGPNQSCPLLKGIPDRSYMYFVHSYYVEPKDKTIIATTTDYGINFVSSVWKDNVFGLQFHPEKSQRLGLQILKNFVKIKC